MPVLAEWRDALDGLADQRRELHGPTIELDLVAGNARDIEQVVDQTREVLDLAFDDPVLACPRAVALQLHQLNGGEDRRERVAQLVAEHREEVVLRAVRGLGSDACYVGRVVKARS